MAARARADGGGGCGGPRAAVASALDVGGVEPDVGIARIREVATPQVGDGLVERPADPRHLARAHAANAHGPRHALDLSGGDAVGDHLRHGGDHGAVDPLVAPDHVLREEAPAPQLRDPGRSPADAGVQAALAVAVPAVGPALAELVGLGVHDLADRRLGGRSHDLLEARHAVVEPRQRRGVGDGHLPKTCHRGHRPFVEPVCLATADSRAVAAPLIRALHQHFRRDQIGGLSGHLSLLSNVYSGHCAC